jgi:hypothetical protein
MNRFPVLFGFFVGGWLTAVGARPVEEGYWARPANEAAVARLRETEWVTTGGVNPVSTLRSRADALAALDRRLGFDDQETDQAHAISALFTNEGHLSHLFANRVGGLLDQRPDEPMQAAVRRFISENSAIWDLQVLDREAAAMGDVLPVPAIESGPVRRGHSYTTLRYEQRWRGHPLVDGTLTVHFADDARLMAISGILVNQADIYFDPEPAFDESDAELLAAEASVDVGPGDDQLHGRVRDLVGFAGERRLIYRVDVIDDSGAYISQAWIDAHSGDIVRQTAQTAEYEAVASTYNVFHPLTVDADWTGASTANSILKSGTYSSHSPSTNAYYHFDNGALMRSPMKVYNEEIGGAIVTFDPNGSTVWDDPPGVEQVGWYNRKFNASHVSYWAQIFRNYLDSTMTLSSAFAPPTGFGPWMTWVIIAGAWTDPMALSRPAATHWGCNFPYPWRNYTGLLAHPTDETGRVCIVLPKVGQTQGQSANPGLDGAYSARVLWHEMGHGIDYLYGSGEMRTDGEPVGLGGSGAFHEPAAAVMQLVTVARHFSTAYAFNDYDTHAGSLIAQVGSSAGTRVDLGAASRKCYPIVGAGRNAYNFGHPLYQAVWEAARGRHCHGASCVNLNDGASTADAMEAAYWALKNCPSGPTSTLSEFAHWFVLYYLSFGTQTQWENRAQIFARHGLTSFYPNVACDGSSTP